MRKAWTFAIGLMALSVLFATGCGTSPAGVSGTLTITTAALPSGTAGAAYQAALAAGGGVAPYTFSLSSGTLPSGIKLSSAGVLSGTPTSSGTSSFTVTVADAGGDQSGRTFSLNIAAAASPLTITTATLPAGMVGSAYNASVSASGGTAPYIFTVSSGSVPSGLSLSSTGMLTGIPTTTGSFGFTVSVADASGLKASQTYSVAVSMFLEIGTLSLDQGTVGTAYSQTVGALGGTAPYSYAITSGSVPAGLSFSSSGVLAGTPTTATGYTFTVTVTDAMGAKASQSYNVLIVSAPTAVYINTLSLPAGTVGSTYSGMVVALGGTPPYSYAVTSGSVPAGLNFSSAGVLSGTPSTAATYPFTVTVTDAKGQTAYQTYSVTIAAASSAVSFTTATTLPTGIVSTAYSTMIGATGGIAPYTFAVTSGSVPAGLTLNGSGLLSGTPTMANTFSFAVKVTDAAGSTASSIFSVEIDAATTVTLLLTTTTTPNAVVNTNYSYSLSVSNGTAPYTYAVAAGSSLTAGMMLSAAGLLSGTPTAVGSTTFTVTFTDGANPKNSGSGTVTLVVVGTTATVTVDTTSTLATVPANFFGLHTSVYDPNLDGTSALPMLLANTGITTLRYPGGGYSDSYHWAEYAITPFYASTTGTCGVLSNGYLAPGADFGHFAQLLLSAGTSGLITIDYGNSVADASGSVTVGSDGNRTCSQPNSPGQPQEAAAWVAYANGSPSSTQILGKDAAGFDWKTIGFWASLRAASPLSTDDGYNFLRIGHAASLGVKFWEIGNELYYGGWATNHNAESDTHAPYIYTNGYTAGGFQSRASLAALSPTAYGTNAIQFIQAMKAVDSTIKIGVDFSSPISTDPIPTTWNPDLAQAVCAGTNIDFAIMHYYPGTYRSVQPGELLSLPQNDIPAVAGNIRSNLAQYCPANASNVQIWLTETAPNNGLAPNFPQPVIGLFTLNEFMTALTTGIQNIDWLELHDGSFLTEADVPGPSYYGILLAHQLAAVGDVAVKASSSTSAIVSYATLKANGQKGVLLINANASSAISVTVTVNGATLGKTATEYSFGVNTTQSGPALAGASFAVPGNIFTVSVPAYTAVELLIP